MMTVDEILDRHAKELDGIKSNMQSISVDLQVLIRDHKYISGKMEEVVKKMESFAMYLYCIENHTKLIEKLVKDYEQISNQQKEFEQRFRIMDEREKARSTLMRFISENWWRVLAALSFISTLSFGIGEAMHRFMPHS